MDLRGIANGAIQVVNPDFTVTVQMSTGYTKTTGQKQVPSYAPGVDAPAQIQALNNKDLQKLEGMNIQGTVQALYIKGPLAGVIRTSSKGGDLVTIASPAPAQWIGQWLTVKVLESWPLWTKVAIVLQNPGDDN
jgi:hypothetical protein